VLVTVNGSRVVDKVTNPITTPQRFQLTMVNSGGKWLASDLLSVGVQ
jgi:flagellar basal body rod protein FlgG